MKSKNELEGLDLNTKIHQEQVSQKVAGHFGNHSRTQPDDSFGQETLQIATRVLYFMENSFNAFSNTGKPAIKCS